ncbi:MAG: sel1 repeat family protein [Alphaproteobacteria bacterium]|nr:sel1 repeat family protein [Alphaproteobacteria bacterium]
MRTILAVFVLLLAFCGTAVAGSWEDGSTAFEQGDKAAAARIWRPLAEQGDLRTQAMLVFMYAEGKGVPQDYAEAIT